MSYLSVLLLIFPLMSQVKINEVCYNPAHPSGYAEKYGEWLEIYNSGSSTIDLSGWLIADENDPDSFGLNEGVFLIPQGITIAPGEFILLVHDIDTFNTYWSSPPGIQIIQFGPQFHFAMSNGGDDLHLFRPDTIEEDAVWWGSGGDMGAFNAAPEVDNNHSIGRYPDGNDTENPADDFHDYSEPSPGDANPPPVLIEDKRICEALKDFQIFVEKGRVIFLIKISGKWKIEIYDVIGRSIKKFEGINPVKIIWNGRDSSSEKCRNGVYHILLRTGKRCYKRKVLYVY